MGVSRPILCCRLYFYTESVAEPNQQHHSHDFSEFNAVNCNDICLETVQIYIHIYFVQALYILNRELLYIDVGEQSLQRILLSTYGGRQSHCTSIAHKYVLFFCFLYKYIKNIIIKCHRALCCHYKTSKPMSKSIPSI